MKALYVFEALNKTSESPVHILLIRTGSQLTFDPALPQGEDGSLGTGTHAQFGKQIIEMEIDRARTNDEQLSDLFVAQALRHESDHIQFTRCQLDRLCQPKVDGDPIRFRLSLPCATQLFEPFAGTHQSAVIEAVRAS